MWKINLILNLPQDFNYLQEKVMYQKQRKTTGSGDNFAAKKVFSKLVENVRTLMHVSSKL